MTHKQIGIVYLVLTVALLMCAAGQACFGANLLLTPGFEIPYTWQHGTSPGTWTIEGWTLETTTGPMWFACSWGVFPVHSGTGSLGNMYMGGEQGHLMTWQEVGAFASTDYTASCWVAAWGDGVDADPFGTAPTDCAAIRIIEYDSTGAVVADNKVAQLTTQAMPMVQLCSTFKTTASTARIRYCLDTLVSETYVSYDKGTFVYYDDCVLDGPTAPAKITGTVKSGGIALASATVADAKQAKSATTDSFGVYTLGGLTGGANETLRASKDGYYPQRKVRSWLSGDTVTLNYDLTAVGSNLLANAGMDDVWDSAWRSETFGANVYVLNESYSAQYSFPVFFDSGEEAVCLLSNGGDLGRQAWVYQVVPVQPNANYTAMCRFHASEGGEAVPPSHWGTPGDGYDAAVYVQEYDKLGEPIGVEHMAYAAETKDWETIELTFKSDEDTRFVRVGGTAMLGYDYSTNLERATFDSFELNGAPGAPLPAFFGTVSSDGVPVAGAGVECVNTPYNTVTDANGYYELVVPAGTYDLRAGKTGTFYNQRRWNIATGSGVNFDLMPENLLANPQFDDQAVYSNGIVIEPGWTSGWDGGGAYTQIIAGGETHSGAYSLQIRGKGQGFASYCWEYQDVSALPNHSYSAKLWAYGYGPGWATGEGDAILLSVDEYDATGSLIVSGHTVNVPIDEYNMDTWIEVSLPSFTTSADTAVLRYRLDSIMVSSTGAYIDDCQLIGSAGPVQLQGVVKDESGVMLLSGAIVKAINGSAIPQTTLTTMTGSTGHYSISSPRFSDYFAVRVSKADYYAQRKYRWTSTSQTADFNLVSASGNLLMNAGMDDGWNAGGWVDSPATPGTYYIEESFTSSWGGPVFYHSGVAAVSIVAELSGAGYWYQRVPVKPLTQYTASGWFIPGTDPRYYHQWGYSDDEQKACLYVEEFDATGTAIPETKRLIDFAESTEDFISFIWDQKSVTFTTTAQTVFVRVGGFANMLDSYTQDLSRAVFDDFVLSGPAATVSLADAKSATDGTVVSLTGQVVTANYDGYFYIEEPDRSSGIKVTGAATVGTTVRVTGPINTVDGERVIDAGGGVVTGAATVDPLGVVGKAATGDALTVGLLIRAWGRVAEVGAGWFTIADGSTNALKVYGVAANGQYVAVTGALGSELSGAKTITVLRATAIDPVDED